MGKKCRNFYRKCGKRILDIFFSLIGILLLLPIYVFLWVLVAIFMGYPVLFCQVRIGKDEKTFNLYKFRSMTNYRDKNGNLLSEEKRLTKFGMFLRSSSLDELPELFSILKGDMSFVGPRPLPIYYMPYFKEKERVRHFVQGGLIPPDVLSGKTVVTWEVQFKYEVYYANHVSLYLDIKILIYTFVVLLKRITTNYGSDFRPHLNEYRSEDRMEK